MPVVLWWEICLFVIILLTLIAPDWMERASDDGDSYNRDYFGRRW